MELIMQGGEAKLRYNQRINIKLSSIQKQIYRDIKIDKILN